MLRISDADETDNGFQMYPQPPQSSGFWRSAGYKPGKRCICMGTVEGDADFTRLVRKKIGKIARAITAR